MADMMRSKPKEQKQEDMSLIDIIGYDRPDKSQSIVNIEFANSQPFISTSFGTEYQLNSSSFNVMLADESVVYDLWQTGLEGSFSCLNGYVDNAMQLFRVNNWSLGAYQRTGADDEYKCQMKFIRTSKKQVAPFCRGLLHKLESNVYNSNLTGTIGTGFNLAGAAVAEYSILQLATGQAQQTALMNTTNGQMRFFIPLALLIPELASLPQGLCFSGLGSYPTFNVSFANFQTAIKGKSSGAAPVTATVFIEGMQLRRVYTKLHEEQLDRLKRAVIPMQLSNFLNYPASWSGSNLNLQYPLPIGARVKTLYVASCFKSTIPLGISPADDTTNIPAAYFTGARTNSFKSALGYFPAFRLKSLAINIGGITRQLNVQQLSVLDVHDSWIPKLLESDIPRDQQRSVLAIPLDRCFSDLFGSPLNGAQTLVSIQLSIDVAAHTMIQQSTDYDPTNFDVKSFIEYSSEFELKHGKMIAVGRSA